ncbi:DUF6510 family protein [Leifsonia sp. NPDC080035]|uniref:DUF6510 family protein n=1 Tax=Leifsonia sp. NPDC080035 TaxID=3143936 RepID=A0AAU7GAW4_9MICO
MTGHDLDYLDGNAAAGLLDEVFAVDVTTARGRCASCGDEAVVARAHVRPVSGGLVLCCAVCEGMLARVTEGAGRVRIDLRGMVWLELSADDLDAT